VSRGTQRQKLADASQVRIGMGRRRRGVDPELETKALCAMPKAPIRNHCRIKLMHSFRFPENAASPIGVADDLPLLIFFLCRVNSDRRKTNEAAQISIWIFNQDKQQTL